MAGARADHILRRRAVKPSGRTIPVSRLMQALAAPLASIPSRETMCPASY